MGLNIEGTELTAGAEIRGVFIYGHSNTKKHQEEYEENTSM
jgi:hypothetical protein